MCCCGRMPPKRGLVRRGEGAQEKPAGARAGCARVRWCTRTYTQRTSEAPSRTRRAGCPEGAPSGVCFFGDFLCTSKESYPLARRASGSSALEDRSTQQVDGLCAASCRAPFRPFAAQMFAPASCVRSPACAGMTSKASNRACAVSARPAPRPAPPAAPVHRDSHAPRRPRRLPAAGSSRARAARRRACGALRRVRRARSIRRPCACG